MTGEDWAPDVDRLLSAVGLELETNAESIPTALRRAVVQLAEHLVQRSSIPIPRYAVGGGGRSSTHGPLVASPPRLAWRW